MKRLWMLLLFALPPLRADFAPLEELTRDWMNLRLERAAEAAAWQTESARLHLEIRLLNEAESRLREELATLRERESEAETEQAGAVQELETRRAALAALQPALDQSRARLREETDRLPPPFRERLSDEIAALEGAEAEPAARARAVLALRNQLLQLQQTLHVTPLVIDLDGQRREMDVLWIGAARAYAVSSDDRLAAEGFPAEGLWQWRLLPGAAPRIRHALRIARNEAPPVLVSLPVEAGQ